MSTQVGTTKMSADVEVEIVSAKEWQKLQQEHAHLRSILQELRIYFHAQGRRPEECYEMSLIDDALMFGPEKSNDL